MSKEETKATCCATESSYHGDCLNLKMWIEYDFEVSNAPFKAALRKFNEDVTTIKFGLVRTFGPVTDLDPTFLQLGRNVFVHQKDNCLHVDIELSKSEFNRKDYGDMITFKRPKECTTIQVLVVVV